VPHLLADALAEASPEPSDDKHLAPEYDHLATEIINLYASIHAANYRLLTLIRVFDEHHMAQQKGFLTTAQWLGWYLGIGSNAAREKVRVVRALSELPVLDAAFEAATLSYSKIRALTRVATPANEQHLLELAECASAQQTERIVRDYARVQAGQAHISTEPELTWQETEQGDLLIKGRLPAEVGALLIQAIAQITDQTPPPDLADAADIDAVPLSRRRAEALIELAEAHLAGHSDRPQSTADRYTVHVDLEDPRLSAAAQARLTCDASLITHVSDTEGGPLGVGRKTRSVPGSLRRALRRRDKGCRFPGCCNTRFVDAHHVHHWADGGDTTMSNLILLCRRHHTLLHEGRFSVAAHQPERGATQFHFYRSSGSMVRARLPATGDVCLRSAEFTQLAPRDVADVSAEAV
jgi:hypothetical protein